MPASCSASRPSISDEARAKHHEFVRRGKRNIYQGLTFWTPNINIFRDPRWGRGRRPTARIPSSPAGWPSQFIRGLQGDDPKYLKTIATAKHYAVHSGPESLRHTFDAVVDDRDLRDTYLPQFEMAVREGGADSVMCAYNRVDGQPACASDGCWTTSCAASGGSAGTSCPTAARSATSTCNHKIAADAAAGVAARA